MRICGACGHVQDSLRHGCADCGVAPQTVEGIEVHAPEMSGQDAEYDPALYAELVRLEAGHFWFRQRNRLISYFVARNFPVVGDYLEIGCGTGFVLGHLGKQHPQWRTSGSELHLEGLRFARQRLPRARLLQMDARRIPFAAEFDLVGSFDVLEHIPEDEAVLHSIRAALKPGGGLLVTVPQHPFLWSSQDEAARHVRRYRRGELEAKISAAGFEVLRSTSFMTMLFPVMLASRLTNRISAAARHDPLREMRTGPLANGIGNLLMRVDRALIASGFDLPFGGSRIIAARKPV